MNKQEFAQIMVAIKGAYPNTNAIPDEAAANLWYAALGDCDYKVVQNAVMEHICTERWPPSIADIRLKCTERLTPMMDWGEAWGEVQRAMSSYGFYREDEALESMSNFTRTAVKRIGFRELCTSDNPVANRAQFRQIYEGMMKEERIQSQLPPGIQRVRTELIQANAKTPEITAKNESAPESVERPEPDKVSKYVAEIKEKLKGF